MDKDIKKRILEILRTLSEKEITCLFYQKAFNLQQKEIAKERSISQSSVYRNLKKANKKLYYIFEHEEVISAIQEIFCLK